MWHRFLIVAFVMLAGDGLAQDPDADRMFEQARDAYREAAKTGDPQRIVDSLRVVLDVALQALPADDERLPIAWMNYGIALANAGDFDTAREIQEYALQLGQEMHGAESEAMVPILMSYADSRSRYGKSDEQERYYRRALKIIAREHGDDSIEYAKVAQRAGSRVLDLSRTVGGRRFLEDAYEIYARELGKDSLEAANSAHYLGRIERLRRKYAKAIEYFFLALDGFEGDARKQNAVRAQLVILLEQEGHADAAVEQLLAIAATRTVADIETNPPIYRAPVADPRSWKNRVTLETVDLEFKVDEKGFVRDPVVIASSGGKMFEAPAVKSLHEWRYVPAVVDGRPVVTPRARARIVFPPRDDVQLPRGAGSGDVPIIPIYRRQ